MGAALARVLRASVRSMPNCSRWKRRAQEGWGGWGQAVDEVGVVLGNR